MKKYNLFIADSDERYITNLMYYISQKFSNKFTTTCFTNYEGLTAEIKKNDNVDIFLINSDFLSEDIVSDNKTVIVLSEDLEQYKDYFCLKKYQSAEKICLDIIKIHEGRVKNAEANKSKEKLNILTFYSPIGGIGTSTVAVSTSYALAKSNKKVLYLNLENIQSTNIFINEHNKSKYNLSDLIISIKNRSNKSIDILTLGINSFNKTKLYYFNQVDSILDIEELTFEDIRVLIESIEESNLFDFVIIDLPSVFHTKYYYLFGKSENVIVMIGQDERSNHKIDILIKQLDSKHNFLFVANKFNKYKERLIPKEIAVNSESIVETIEFNEEIEGSYNLDQLLKVNGFKRKIDELINNIS